MMKHVYALVVVLAMVLIVRTFFHGQATAVTNRVAERVGVDIAPTSAPTPKPPEEAARFTVRPEMKDLLADDSLTRAVFAQLADRYRASLIDLKHDLDSAGAKLLVVSFGVEGGRHPSELEGRWQKVAMAACKSEGIPFYNFGDALDDAYAKGVHVSLMPKDGHLSREGAAIVARQLAAVVREHGGYRNQNSFSAAARPKSFGDLEPNQDKIVDMGIGLPYRLKTNSQGLRMDYDVGFPKTKQRILLIGNSFAYFPFLDNDKTGSGLLQAMSPDKEILNGAMLAYSTFDQRVLWAEKAKFAEPDIVILQENGMDIIHMFFTFINWQDRHKNYRPPSEAERAWYEAHLAKG